MTSSNCSYSPSFSVALFSPPPSSSIANKNAPGLANVDDVHTIDTGLPQVGLHVHLKVLGTEVALAARSISMSWLVALKMDGRLAGAILT